MPEAPDEFYDVVAEAIDTRVKIASDVIDDHNGTREQRALMSSKAVIEALLEQPACDLNKVLAAIDRLMDDYDKSR